MMYDGGLLWGILTDSIAIILLVVLLLLGVRVKEKYQSSPIFLYSSVALSRILRMHPRLHL